ncbi:rhomboid family intramembrane serine protease [Enterococcus hirae]|jgi:rhomboid protease GluP|nr:rhomboid family intramembrane serine protease [Enterococcaceae bacterium]MDM8212836.1 rhomboid family intramembrane serine protease [Enterococcus hirae]
MERLRKLKNDSWMTYLLMAITVLIFLWMEIRYFAQGGSESIDVLIKYGAMERPDIIYNHQYWRFITPMFLHIGWTHIVVNMATLYFVGREAEVIFGKWRYLLLYLGSGILGNVASFALGSANSVSAGASTSLFGLFGAFIILGRIFRGDQMFEMLAKRYGLFIAMNLLFNIFSPSIDMMGHIGGFIGGLILADVLGTPRRSSSFAERFLTCVLFAFLLAGCFLFGMRRFGAL